MVQKPIRKMDDGISWVQNKIVEREVTVKKDVVQDTLEIPYLLVEKIVYDYLNMKGIINDCDKFEMVYDDIEGNFAMYLERFVIDGRDDRIVV
ncbi:hypothetical protein EVB55_194 [Rhizobium phage RHph_Y68]|uniref:Uncharacterized protein n=1 Tax=Rhizobium phage RHph_Y68 TaxID=2509787 RepID=A0A7S5R9R2_9CAUD|nr:hypothetical protein PP934_gp194 [Rhizobium phage RHph_Y68]QIG68129.1 hypothetical protein EVB55_194 [Rhizobium phage RHph_Y68]